MRILICYNSVVDARSVSGVQRHFAGVVRYWIFSGHTVDFYLPRAAWPVFREMFPNSGLISSDSIFDFTDNLHQTWRFFFAYGWRMITCHFSRFKDRYDIVYAAGQAIFEVYPSYRLAKRFGSAWMCKVHHVLAGRSSRTGFFDRLFLFTERLSTRLLNRCATLILCSTPVIADEFSRLQVSLNLQPRHGIATGYGVDIDEYKIGDLSQKMFDVVILGRVHEQKGVFDVPAFWRAVLQARPDAKLLVIGEGPKRRELTKLMGDAGFGSSVKFTGAVSDAVKNAYLQATRVGVSFSREEGWGLSITEFLASGLPVVAMELPVFRTVFEDHLDYVAMGDVAAAANAVLRWLGDPDLAVRQGILNRHFVAKYDYKDVAIRELEEITKAVERVLV